MQAKIVLLPGDGIGPEVVEETVKVLNKLATIFNHQFDYQSCDIGGISIDKYGTALTDEVIATCKQADAILLGAVGGPKWDDPKAKTRPEAGLLKIRKELGLFANLRPVKTNSALVDASPLKREIVDGVDILFYRELTGGIYFGESGSRIVDGEEESYNVASYKRSEIERIVRMAADAARQRNKHLTMVDKANVLEVSRLWRRVSEEIIKQDYSDLKYDVVLVDAMAMHLISKPKTFDVVVTSNLFGDILTDEASMLPGSMGLLPSASLSSSGPGLYEPIHGSAPDIAGMGIANPLATILASAMLLRHSLKLYPEAAAVETAVEKVLNAGYRTKDIAYGRPAISTKEMGNKVCEML